jgi:hypothetical protein
VSEPLALTLEAVLTGHGYADLDASPLQLAIARAADGRPLEGCLDASAMRAHFGVDELPSMPVVALVVLVCGVRSGKSFLAACAAIKGCLTADLSKLKRHEIPRFAIVAPTVDNANATFRILAGIIHESDALSRLVVKETSDELQLRRLDGRIVEIVVVAAHRGAITMRSRWLIGFVLEEVAGFGEEVTGAAVNGEALLQAGETRLVPGSQGWIISSPFGPTGLLWELYKKHFGRPGRELVVHAPTTAMNPTFDPAQVEAVRQRDPDTAAREYEAQWLDSSTTLLSAAGIDKCTRKGAAELPWEEGHSYTAAMDAATRGNSWTLVVSTRKQVGAGFKDVIVCARQWTGSKSTPLDPKVVLAEIATTLKRYQLDYVWADEYGSDFVRRPADDCGLYVCLAATSAAQKLDRYQGLAMQIANGDIEFPPDEVLRRDLLGIKKVARQGSVQIVLPNTPDGRHADYAPSIVMALHKRPADPEPEPPKFGSLEWAAYQQLEIEKALVHDMEKRLEEEREARRYEQEFYGGGYE